MDKTNGKVFSDELLQWYSTVRRDLPWRRNADPYQIWVSEVMLQQTRVETVIPYFERFMRHFPTLAALAEASEEDVVKEWEGLGYYSRARNLQAAVREVAERYGGVVPDSYADMLSLRGVGSYTAGAVLSIAYGLPVPAVDGNVMRVFARLYGLQEDVSTVSAKKQIESWVQAMLPADRASDFNQALMELGALICLPKTPRCRECPVRSHCSALAEGTQVLLPIKKRKKTPQEQYFVGYLAQAEETLCVRRRPQTGLLAGLWEVPMTPIHVTDTSIVTREHAASFAHSALSGHGFTNCSPLQYLGQYTHVFSHIKWIIWLFQTYSTERASLPAHRWISPEERAELSFGQVFRRMFADHLDNEG